MDRLDLANRESIHQLFVAPSLTRLLATEFTNLTGIKLLDDAPAQRPAISQSPTEISQREAWLASIIQGGVSVSGGEKTNLVQVTFRSTNPIFAAEIANALVDAYIELGATNNW